MPRDVMTSRHGLINPRNGARTSVGRGAPTSADVPPVSRSRAPYFLYYSLENMKHHFIMTGNRLRRYGYTCLSSIMSNSIKYSEYNVHFALPEGVVNASPGVTHDVTPRGPTCTARHLINVGKVFIEACVS